MPVPSAISDLSTTPGLNSPSGSESPASIDDYLRTHAAFIRQVSDASVKTSGAQTIDGAKTFSSPIAGSITGNAATATVASGLNAILPVDKGGTGQSTAADAFNALKQAASETATGVVELATAAEAQAGVDTARVLTPATLRSGMNASGSAPVYACRAWVNFKGTDTVAIRAAGNVSSITDNGTGDYTVNFTTAMADANYAAKVNAGTSSGGFSNTGSANQRTAGSVRLTTNNGSNVLADFDLVDVTIFR